MKNLVLTLALCVSAIVCKAQNDIDVFLAAGVDDAQRFANDYLAPGSNGLMHSMNANWFSSAKTKPLAGFEISVMVNAAMVKDEHKIFNLNIADYHNVQFESCIENDACLNDSPQNYPQKQANQ